MANNIDSTLSNATEPAAAEELIGSSASTAHAAVDGAAEDAEHLLDRVVQGAHDGIDALADTAAPHVQRLQEGFAVARDTGEEWAESVRCTVRQHPLASLAAAAALGMLVARLTR